jgi:cysteinyl-tRNA synthetase
LAQYNELPVYKATYDLLLAIFQFTKEFSKEYKYSVGESLKNETIELLTLIYRANTRHQKSDVLQIAREQIHSNTANITNLSDAQNYLYLISTDNYSSKQEMIHAISATNFDVVLVDLFFNETEFTVSEVNQLKTKANGGKRLVISYISIGSAEKYRYYWKKDWGLHHPLWLKKKYDGYTDEFWVNFWEKEWQTIIYGNDNSYMKKIITAGFDGAYLDNVEAYYFLFHNE